MEWASCDLLVRSPDICSWSCDKRGAGLAVLEAVLTDIGRDTPTAVEGMSV